MTVSFFKDFFYKVRVLLDGDAPSEDEAREARGSRSIDEAMNEEYHAPEKMEYDYAEDDYDDYEESPSSLAQRMADEYIDDEDDYEEEDEYFDEQPEPSYQRGYDEPDEDEQYFVPQPAVREEPQPEQKPLPNRTEVTLREIARLSQKLDDATLEEYKRRIVMTKQQTGAVSALEALRILREYVDDNDYFDSNGDGLPDLSAK